jgi:segregation and condensation protein B
MATRKTREELDAEMQSEAAEPQAAPEHSEPAPAVAAAAQLSTIVESLLFAAGDPVDLKDLLKVLQDFQPDLGSRELKELLEQLRIDLREQGRGVRVAEVGGGFQLRTPSEAAPYIKKLVSRRPPRLTRATLETLAIVAYRQPTTRGEVEEIRGVDSGAVLKHLLDKRLVKILGRKDEPGRPLLYGTTREFLAFFSLKDLGSLPTLRDFTELSDEHRASLGLAPKELEAQELGREEIEEALQAEFTDAYAPVGDDEVVQELAEAISELRKRDRDLKKVLPPALKQATPETQEPEKPADPQEPATVEVPPADDQGSPEDGSGTSGA